MFHFRRAFGAFMAIGVLPGCGVSLPSVGVPSAVNQQISSKRGKKQSQTFAYTGAPQNFTVPNGVSEVRITASGASGTSTASAWRASSQASSSRRSTAGISSRMTRRSRMPAESARTPYRRHRSRRSDYRQSQWPRKGLRACQSPEFRADTTHPAANLRTNEVRLPSKRFRELWAVSTRTPRRSSSFRHRMSCRRAPRPYRLPRLPREYSRCEH